MNHLAGFLLWAQAKPLQPKPGDWAFGWGAVGIIAVVATAIVLMIWFVMLLLRYRARQTTHSPWQLFNELCAAHRMTQSERSLLRQLAKSLRLDQPAVLFVEPAWWDHDRLPPALRRQVTSFEKLRKRLFAPR